MWSGKLDGVQDKLACLVQKESKWQVKRRIRQTIIRSEKKINEVGVERDERAR